MNPHELRAQRPHFPFNRNHGQHEVFEILPGDAYRTAWFSLTACPFCGGQEQSVCDRLEIDDPRSPVYVVVCPECGCNGPWAKTETQAIHFWNAWNNTETCQLTDWEHKVSDDSKDDQPF